MSAAMNPTSEAKRVRPLRSETNSFTRLCAYLRKKYPTNEIVILMPNQAERQLRAESISYWQLDIHGNGKSLNILWHPAHGFGVSLITSIVEYGQNPSKFRTLGATMKQINKILKS